MILATAQASPCARPPSRGGVRGADHRGLRRRQLLPAVQQHAWADGGLHREDFQAPVTSPMFRVSSLNLGESPERRQMNRRLERLRSLSLAACDLRVAARGAALVLFACTATLSAATFTVTNTN